MILPSWSVYGDKDSLVPYNQSELLHEALKEAKVEVQLYTVKNGGHGGFKDRKVDTLVAAFFKKHLGR